MGKGEEEEEGLKVREEEEVQGEGRGTVSARESLTDQGRMRGQRDDRREVLPLSKILRHRTFLGLLRGIFFVVGIFFLSLSYTLLRIVYFLT